MTMDAKLAESFAKRNALKIISGLNNFDGEKVTSVCRAAEVGGATFVDIAAAPDLIKSVRQLISLPICASAVEPEALVESVAAGADLVEIGNFDSWISFRLSLVGNLFLIGPINLKIVRNCSPFTPSSRS